MDAKMCGGWFFSPEKDFAVGGKGSVLPRADAVAEDSSSRN